MTIDSVDPVDWALIVAAKPNVLVCGEKSFTDELLDKLLPHCRFPVQELPTHFERLQWCVSPNGTVLLPKVDTYNRDQQRALMAWVENDGHAEQLISTTGSPVIDLVQNGGFRDDLFYRLNTVYLDLGCPSEHTWQH